MLLGTGAGLTFIVTSTRLTLTSTRAALQHLHHVNQCMDKELLVQPPLLQTSLLSLRLPSFIRFAPDLHQDAILVESRNVEYKISVPMHHVLLLLRRKADQPIKRLVA